MAKPIWKRLPEQLEILIRDGETLEKPKPSELDAALDDYELRLGFRFPTSYRQFIHWFGPGALSSWFLICAPIPRRFRGRVANVCDMEKQREMLEQPDGYWAQAVSPEKLRRFVLFAATEGGDWFFWDTADVRIRSQHEYGVYYHAHENGGGKVKLIAPSFKAFVTEVGLGQQYPLSKEKRETKWTVWPAWPTTKRKRGKRIGG